MKMLRKNRFNKNGGTQQAVILSITRQVSVVTTYFNIINSTGCSSNTLLYNIHVLSYLLQILYSVTTSPEKQSIRKHLKAF